MKLIGHTNRLFLRETSVEDAEMMYHLNNDPEVIQFTGDPPFASVDEAAKFLHDYDHFKKYNRGRWAVVDKENGETLGWCGLKYHENNGENDLGYRLSKKYWNKGYATEASHLALHYGFRRLGLESIIARAVDKNVASLKVMQKLGLEYECNFEDHGSQCEQHRIEKYSYLFQFPEKLEIVIY